MTKGQHNTMTTGRTYRDAHDIEVELVELLWQDTYSGIIDGSVRIRNQAVLTHRLPALLQRWKHLPHVIIGRDEHQADGQLLPEMIAAQLTSMWRPAGAAGFGRTHLVVAWFSSRYDPFARLGESLATIDWATAAVDIRWD
jgi:hypothetical protein